MGRFARREGVLRISAPGSRWLQTGHGGGYRRADAAYNVTVPEGFDRTDLAAYASERRERAGFDLAGPTLLTGVDQRHARAASIGPVVAVATAGLSNPAALPMDPDGDGDGGESDGDGPDSRDADAGGADDADADGADDADAGGADGADAGGSRPAADPDHDGTVNVIVGVDRSLADGALATLLGVIVEAKAATLLDAAGVPGTTSDAAAVGSVVDAPEATFAGSATPVGDAARACVRAAVQASLASRYAEASLPSSVEAAEYGVVTTRDPAAFDPR